MANTARHRYWIIGICIFLALCILYSIQPTDIRDLHIPHLGKSGPGRPSEPPRPPQSLKTERPEWAINPTCRGARGGRIDFGQSDDLPHSIQSLRSASDPDAGDRQYPIPTYGSYEALKLEKSWMTFAQRYGPYGYGEQWHGYNYSRVDWNSVKWAQLQDECLLSQPNRSFEQEFLQSGAPPRFRLASAVDVLDPPSGKTGRQAIVLRTWSTYKYVEEDMWNIRSIITEASLASQGAYTVFLLVDVKREDGARIHEDDAFYRQVLEESVPEEFWDIAVLFHKSLLFSWYPKIPEHSAFYQNMQPFQLFGHFFLEFDHFWQFEMDTRFLGDAGKMLQAFHEFGRDQPYKQSRERASWTFIPKVHKTYEEFSAGIDKALDGGATVWGPLDTGISGFKPVGQKPPMNPKDDDFEYLVGEDADLLLYTSAFDITRIQTPDDWPFVEWKAGFDSRLKRLGAFPAQARASRTLLEAIHVGQRDLGLKIHSEATLPSFALWHGLKIVQVPLPKFTFPERDVEELNWIYNGGPPTAFKDGIANGPAPYRSQAVRWYARPRTFEWSSSLIEPVWKYWMNEHVGEDEQKRGLSTSAPIPDELPAFLEEVDGLVYAPNFMLHPRKTNKNV